MTTAKIEGNSVRRGREVSSKLLSFFDDVAKSTGVRREDLFAGHESLIENRPSRVSWDVLCDLYERTEKLCTQHHTLEELGTLMNGASGLSLSHRVLSRFASPVLLYRIAHRWAGPSLLRNVEVVYEELAGDRLHIEYKIPAEYRDCPQMFAVNIGTLSGVTTLIGLEPARVQSIIEVRHQSLEIQLPRSRSIFTSIRRFLRSLASSDAVIRAMSEQELELREQFEQLRRAYVELDKSRITAEKALAAKSDFLAVMSHELRTPLNGIFGAAMALRDDEIESQREMVDLLDESAQKMLDVVEYVLQFSELAGGESFVRPAAFSPQVALHDLAAEFTPVARSKHLDLHYKASSDLPLALIADASFLVRIARELIKNAIMFTMQGSIEIRLGGRAQGDGYLLELQVSDSGIGIAKEDLDRVFEPFTSVDQTSTRAVGGIGLGLATCRRLVAAVDGHLQVDSEIGRGTTFTATIPCSLDSELQVDASAAVQVSAVSNTQDEFIGSAQEDPRLGAALVPLVRSPHVLVVEDDAVSRRVLLEALRQRGLQADVVENGVEAIEAAQKTNYQVIFMDLQMPLMDGREAARKLSQDPRTGAIPIVAITSNTSEMERKRCRTAGMKEFLAKPLQGTALDAVLARLGVCSSGATSYFEDASYATNRTCDWPQDVRILLVEDSEVRAKVVVAMLERLGIAVDCFRDRLSAVEATTVCNYGLIFLDLDMPQQDGFEAVRQLRAQVSSSSRTPIIAMTMRCDALIRQRCAEAEIDEMLTKPLSATHLQAVLEKWALQADASASRFDQLQACS